MTNAPRCTQAPDGNAALAAAAISALVPELHTDRLALRAPRVTDLGAWTAILAEAPFELGPEEAWTAFCTYAAGWLLHGHGLWAVERRADETLIGFVHLGLEWEDIEPELGWMFLPEHRGAGLATEAALAARDHGLTALGAGSFVSYVAPENFPSNRLAERIGGRRDPAAEAALSGPAGERTHVWRHGGVA
jgi:RimJ/RimL family protein N-acetyltransferase